MANVKFKHGNSANLTNENAPFAAGTVYFSVDSDGYGRIYFDNPDSANNDRVLVGIGLPSEDGVYAIKVSNTVDAENANYASSAGYAETADKARIADEAVLAATATNANKAIEASYAESASEAEHALKADSATNADNAVLATTAENAINAENATYAASAGHSGTADSALEANAAVMAVNDHNNNKITTTYVRNVYVNDNDKLTITRLDNNNNPVDTELDISGVSSGGQNNFLGYQTLSFVAYTNEPYQRTFRVEGFELQEGDVLDFYVNGFKVPYGEVSVDIPTNTIILVNAPEVVGTEVEAVVRKPYASNEEISLIDINRKLGFYKQSVEPQDRDAIWIDTSIVPYVLRFFNGQVWEGMNTFQ